MNAAGFVYPGGTLSYITAHVKDIKPQKDEPNAIVLMAGDIKAKNAVPAENIAARYSQLINEVKHTFPWARILVSGLPRVGNGFRQNFIRDTNHQLEIAAANDRLLTYIDNSNAKLRDSIHITSASKSKLSAKISTCVKKLF